MTVGICDIFQEEGLAAKSTRIIIQLFWELKGTMYDINDVFRFFFLTKKLDFCWYM